MEPDVLRRGFPLYDARINIHRNVSDSVYEYIHVYSMDAYTHTIHTDIWIYANGTGLSNTTQGRTRPAEYAAACICSTRVTVCGNSVEVFATSGLREPEYGCSPTERSVMFGAVQTLRFLNAANRPRQRFPRLN